VKTQCDISYNPDAGPRGLGDLLLPDRPTGHPVLLIHGGGWNALTKESIEPMGRRLAERGRAVFNINYRLLDQCHWPACADDCVAAGKFMLAGKVPGLGKPEKLLVAGASAGGHLAMMTGLTLPKGTVEAILSLAGPALMDFPDGSSGIHFESLDFRRKFFGHENELTPEEILAVSPAKLVKPGAPPLYCIHSQNDKLVPLSHTHAAVAAWRAVGAKAESYIFDGPGDSHGFWDSEDRSKRQPIPAVVEAFEKVLKDLGR
jgi:acetyl esterase/lipase